MLHRFAFILHLTFYLALGTGALEYFHNLQHAAEDAQADRLVIAKGRPVESHHHDDNNCETHASIHLAFFFSRWTWVILCLGLLRLSVAVVVPPLISRLPLLRIDCRGPPMSLLGHV